MFYIFYTASCRELILWLNSHSPFRYSANRVDDKMIFLLQCVLAEQMFGNVLMEYQKKSQWRWTVDTIYAMETSFLLCKKIKSSYCAWTFWNRVIDKSCILSILFLSICWLDKVTILCVGIYLSEIWLSNTWRMVTDCLVFFNVTIQRLHRILKKEIFSRFRENVQKW